jgi:hypothetical protein
MEKKCEDEPNPYNNRVTVVRKVKRLDGRDGVVVKTEEGKECLIHKDEAGKTVVTEASNMGSNWVNVETE